jgi:uncharacterized protein YkwD
MVGKCKHHKYVFVRKGMMVCTECGHERKSLRQEKKVIKTAGILIAFALVLLVAYQNLPWITNNVNMISKEATTEIPIITNATVLQTQKLVNVTNHVTSSVVILIPKVKVQQVPPTVSRQNPENLQTTNNTVQAQTTSTNNVYSHDELANYALQLINSDRQTAGLPPVKLSQNKAAQVHAEDMFKVRFLSHYMTDGEKPYMVYTKYDGLGYVAQNAAFQGYQDISQCSNPNTICDAINPKDAMRQAEYNMMNNDQASNWGHRDNILDKDHTTVSIGIVYDQYSFYMTQNFENNYLQYTKPISKNNGIVSFSGTVSDGTIDNIEIAYDDLPTSSTYDSHKNDGFYKLGDYITNVQAPVTGNNYYLPSDNTFEVADRWNIQANSVDISFDLTPFVTKPGVYTVVVYVKNNGESIPSTSYSITKTSAMVQEGFRSPKVYYACTATQISQYNQLQQQKDTLDHQIDSLKPQVQSIPSTVPQSEYDVDMAIINHYNELVNEDNNLGNKISNFRC